MSYKKSIVDKVVFIIIVICAAIAMIAGDREWSGILGIVIIILHLHDETMEKLHNIHDSINKSKS